MLGIRKGPGHAKTTVKTREENRFAGGATCDLDRLVLGVAASPLFTVALDDEEGVVDPNRESNHRDHVGNKEGGFGRRRPMNAVNAERRRDWEISARMTGTPAATSAPKTITRMISAAGIPKSSAFERSSSAIVLNLFAGC